MMPSIGMSRPSGALRTVHCAKHRANTARVRAVTQQYQPPSTSTASSELDALSRFSELVPDTQMFSAVAKPTAATVSCTLLRGITNSPSVANRPYENAISTAHTYDKCSSLVGPEKLACQMDKALANVGVIYASEVSGRVCTEVDPRLATDTDAMVARAQHLVELYQDMGVPQSKLIMRLPATWQGIQAAGKLEQQGVATQVFLVHSMVQGVAAAQAGVSVIQPNVGRVRDWYNKHPGVIRDPKGPREDSGFASRVDPGVSLVQALYAYIKKFHPSTRIMASGLRTKEDAVALAGCDYLILGPKVMQAMASTPTLQGYNDSLHTADSSTDGLQPQLTVASAAASSAARQETITQEVFDSELGVAGQQLLDSSLKRLLDDVEEVLPYFANMTVGTE